MDPLVSVIIPIYNVEKYIDKCVESVTNQTYRNLEIILVDDGSPDACPEKCDDWAARDQRIRVIHKQNGGVSSARNLGLDASRGEYIFFADADDYVTPNAVEVMLKRIFQDQSDMVVARKRKVYPNGENVAAELTPVKDTVVSKDEALHMIGTPQKPFPVGLVAKLYRKFIFDEIRFADLKSGEDACAIPFIIDRCNLISIMDTVVYFYFQRDDSAVHTMTRDKQLDGIKSVVQVGRFLLDRGYLKEAKVFYLSAVCRHIDLRYDRDAKKIITEAFSREERKKLRSRDRKAMLCILAHNFPRIYKLYTFLKDYN